MSAIWDNIISAIIGAAFGIGGAIITFREQLSTAAIAQTHAKELAQRDRQELEKSLAQLREDNEKEAERIRTEYRARFQSQEKLSLAMLNLLIDIARKMEVEHRYSDLVSVMEDRK